MKDSSVKTAVLAMTAVLVGSAMRIDALGAPADSPKAIAPLVKPLRPATSPPLAHAAPAIPREEPPLVASPNAGFAASSVFSAATSNAAMPNAQTLSGPVTLTYSGSSPAFSLTATGTGKGLSAAVANAGSGSSALYGQTVGSGAGLTGYNLGTGGPGGKFEVTNASSQQAGAFASTNGMGSGLVATVTNTASDTAAVYGQSLAGPNYGWGVEGDGNSVGVLGYVPPSSTHVSSSAVYGQNDASTTDPGQYNYGVYGIASGNAIGVAAIATTSYGLLATSDSNYAVYAQSSTGNAIYAESDSTAGAAIVASISGTGNAINAYSSATSGYGVYGQSANGIGVYGYDTGGGTGIRGYSYTGFAGEFVGTVLITKELTVGTMVYTSDRNLKSDSRPIDGKDLLARVSELPISSWNYSSDPKKRHIGPMAQDFHAAFGLNGADDKHISAVDIAGVSLAAIQELNSQIKLRDTQIAELQARVAKFEARAAELTAQAVAQARVIAEMQQGLSARMTALERRRVDSTQSVSLKHAGKQFVAIN